jgi:HSP90 family molecular chaperone
VLYVSEPIDEMTLQNIERFNGKPIIDVGKELAEDLTDDEKRSKDEANETYESMRQWMKQVLGDKVTKVEVSTRLVDSPATLVQSEYGVSPNMQKYLRAQAVVESQDKGEFANVFNQAVLEINPAHPIIAELKAMQTADATSDAATQTVELVFNTAALAAGYALDNAAEYAKLVTAMMTRLADK